MGLVVAALTLGCATTGGEPTIDLGVDALVDVNPTSATADQLVDPRDYEGVVSAWYFGHAT